LEEKPIVVLSNNDGCVVARSNEAKKMGIKEGIPYFQLEQQFPGQKIAVFSSNYELYGELTGRVVSRNTARYSHKQHRPHCASRQ
jgi:DNA polymerase V